MPIDEIDFAASWSATVTDEFELQYWRKRMTKHEIEWQCFKIDRPKTKLTQAFAHSSVREEIENTFFLFYFFIGWRGDENGRENL